jgi:hypothetical protein
LFTPEQLNAFVTPSCAPQMEALLEELRNGISGKNLKDWVDGRKPLERSGAVAVIACCMFGGDKEAANRVGDLDARSIYAYRHGERRAGGDEPGIGQGNCRKLCAVVAREYAQRSKQSDVPEYVVDYKVGMGALAPGQWIKHSKYGDCQVTRRLKPTQVEVRRNGYGTLHILLNDR